MDLSQFLGMDYLTTDFNLFYETAVNKLDRDRVMAYVPFTLRVLKEAYLQDKNFNTSLTPLPRWDRAAGAQPVTNPRASIQFSGGVRTVLSSQGVTSVSLSECVCLLKTAAAMAVRDELRKRQFRASGILWDTDTCTNSTLPKETLVPIEVTAECDPDNMDEIADTVGDWLSDEFGYCHFGFNLEPVQPEPDSEPKGD